MTTLEQEPTGTASTVRFPDPYEIETPAGAEGWQSMYPYYNHFLAARRAIDSAAPGSATACTSPSRCRRSTSSPPTAPS